MRLMSQEERTIEHSTFTTSLNDTFVHKDIAIRMADGKTETDHRHEVAGSVSHAPASIEASMTVDQPETARQAAVNKALVREAVTPQH